MKKSINLWAFPYPDRMTLRECLQLAKDAGFDGIELNYDLDNDLSPKAGPAELRAIRKLAEKIGIAISGLCSFLFWPYSSAEQRRRQAGARSGAGRQDDRGRPRAGHREPAGRAGRPTSPGAPTTSRCPTTSATAGPARRSASCCPRPRSWACHLNIENIFFNGYLMTPERDERLRRQLQQRSTSRVHFDTGNIMLFQFPEHWIPAARQAHQERALQGVHEEGDRPLAGVVPPAAGRHHQLAGRHGGARRRSATRGYLTFEYFHPFLHYPEALIYQTSDALDRMLGRKS